MGNDNETQIQKIQKRIILEILTITNSLKLSCVKKHIFSVQMCFRCVTFVTFKRFGVLNISPFKPQRNPSLKLRLLDIVPFCFIFGGNGILMFRLLLALIDCSPWLRPWPHN